MKGGLSIDDPSGQRWDLALDLLAEGRDFVMLGNVQLSRPTGRGADGRLHFAVLTEETAPTIERAQADMDNARTQIEALLEGDGRFRELTARFGVVWEYCGDDGTATWLLGEATDDGVVHLRM